HEVEHREHVLSYAPGLVGNQAAAEITVRVPDEEWDRAVSDLQKRVKELNDRACHGQLREDNRALEDAAWNLAKLVLPPGGFERLLAPGYHPRIETGDIATYQIPWEVLEERQRRGSCGHRSHAEDHFHCPYCGVPLNLVIDKLALNYHLTHL